ncbi:O-antigen ligase family protein [Thalassotalea sp. PLHSN55]|uniref:O-antigen ligase family protein n=1 Tax=Thalassotalea sp. PLHSN55 TaxID=3435888 RepID=UPI003F87659E
MNGLPQPLEKYPAFAFVLTLLFTFFIFIRPQEIFIAIYGVPFIAVLSVLILIVILLAHRPIKFTPQYALLLMIYPLTALSGLLNGWLGEGVEQANRYLTSCLIPLFIFATVFTSPARQKSFMWLALISACIFVHNGYVQQNSFDGFGWSGTDYVEDGRIRYLGIFRDPNDLGVFFMMNIPFALYFIKHSNAFGKTLALGCLSAILYGIYMTNSRGTMLAVIGLTGLYFLIRYGGVKAIIYGLIFAPIVIFVVSTFRAVSSQEASAMGRLWAWWDGLEMLKANPIFGVGSNNFTEHHGRVAHNTYIQMAAELGLSGYFIWTTVLFLTLFMGFQAVMYVKDKLPEDITEEVKAELALSSTFFFSLCGFSMTAFFLTRHRFIVYFMISGLLIASYQRLTVLLGEEYALNYKKTIRNILLISSALLIFVYIILKLTV